MGTKLIQNFNEIAFEKLISQRLVIQMEPNLVFLEIKKQGQNFPEQFIRQTGILKLLLHQMLRKKYSRSSYFYVSMLHQMLRKYSTLSYFYVPNYNTKYRIRDLGIFKLLLHQMFRKYSTLSYFYVSLLQVMKRFKIRIFLFPLQIQVQPWSTNRAS